MLAVLRGNFTSGHKESKTDNDAWLFKVSGLVMTSAQLGSAQLKNTGSGICRPHRIRFKAVMCDVVQELLGDQRRSAVVCSPGMPAAEKITLSSERTILSLEGTAPSVALLLSVFEEFIIWDGGTT